MSKVAFPQDMMAFGKCLFTVIRLLLDFRKNLASQRMKINFTIHEKSLNRKGLNSVLESELDFVSREHFLQALARGNPRECIPVKLSILRLLRRYGCLSFTGLRRRLETGNAKVSIGCLHNYIKDLSASNEWDGLLERESAGRKVFFYVKNQPLLDWLFADVEPPLIDPGVTREIIYYLNVTTDSLRRVLVRSHHSTYTLLEYSPILLMKFAALSISPVTAVKLLNKLVKVVGSDTTVYELDELLAKELAKIDTEVLRRFQHMLSDRSQLRSFETLVENYSPRKGWRGLWGPSAERLRKSIKLSEAKS